MDLWQYLAATDKTVVLYGMGNGADKVLAVCARYGISVQAVFASDEFVRGQTFQGMRVCRFADILERFGAENVIVLVCFASALPDVMEAVERVAASCETYIPDVPVRGDTLFTADYEAAHRADLAAAREVLADERSRAVFDGVLNFRRTGRLAYLKATEESREAVMREVLRPDRYRTVIDAGAYDGDTAREMIDLCPHMERIWALEPDRRSFRKLTAYAECEERAEVIPVQAAAWSAATTLVFEDSGNRNAGVDEEDRARRQIQVPAVALDDILPADVRVDLIKYDVEGSERQALAGSARLIREQAPDLLISLYHRTEDLHELIRYLHELRPDYRLYLRRYPYIPAWDLNLYAIKE